MNLFFIGFLLLIYTNDINSTSNYSSPWKLLGFRVRENQVVWSSDNPPILEIPINIPVEMELFGLKMNHIVFVAFTNAKNFTTNKNRCGIESSTVGYKTKKSSDYYALVDITIKHSRNDRPLYYFCIAFNTSTNNSSGTVEWLFQGSESYLSFRTFEKKSLLPLWLQISIIIILFVLSGLFSGLNLGLMALNLTELNIVEQAGSVSERRYAKIIKPVRKRGNFLLCTLLLGNVLVNNTLAILMDDLTGSGLMAVIFSTVGIVILGEIIPQAICSRHGLCIGAKTIWITKFFMIMTGILSFPISLLLDLVLGKELGQVYNREKLTILIKEQQFHGSVVKAEAQIISGALTLTTKTVHDIMTPLCDVFMISHDAVLDFMTMNEIVRNGFTRVPIYNDKRNNISAVLNVKDLAFIDPDDKIPVATVCQFYNRSILVVDEMTNLRSMLEDFRQGKAHMAFVERMITDGEGDPYKETIGLVTLEDVIEEIIQAEIMDETDVITDNVRKQRRMITNQDFSVFNIPETGKYPRLSPQLKVAALRHLSSNVKYFGEDYISSQVLQSLLNANIVVEHTYKSNNDEVNDIYRSGVAANYAILILQGKVNVIVSNEGLLFEGGPFVLFGEMLFERSLENFPNDDEILSKQHTIGSLIQSISEQCQFIPDYSVTASSNLQYLKITSKHYLFARILTILQNTGNNASPSKLNLDKTMPHTEWGGAGDAQQSTINKIVNANEPQLNLDALRNKKSLTTASLHLMRDFYQREWENIVENKTDEDSSQPQQHEDDNDNDKRSNPSFSVSINDDNRHNIPLSSINERGDDTGRLNRYGDNETTNINSESDKLLDRNHSVGPSNC